MSVCVCVCRCVRPPLVTSVPVARSEPNFVYIIWGMSKTDWQNKKNRKSEKIGKNRKIEKFQNIANITSAAEGGPPRVVDKIFQSDFKSNKTFKRTPPVKFFIKTENPINL